MIVLIVNQHRIVVFKYEGQSPVTVDPYRPVTIQAPSQRMKSPTGNVHLFWRSRLVQGCKLAIEFFSLVRLNASLAAFLKKRL